MTAPNAAFVIRDGVLFVRDWEWESTQDSLTGFALTKVMIEPATLATDLYFENGLLFRFLCIGTVEKWPGGGCGDLVAAYWHAADASPNRQRAAWSERRRLLDADALLRLIADIASRPPHQQEEGMP